MFSNKELIIPEYKIDLINRSKKIINSFENINSLVIINKNNKNIEKIKTGTIKDYKATAKTKGKIKKTKIKKKIKTLWVRRKKKN